MRFEPAGFYVWVELKHVDQEVQEGVLAGLVLTSNFEHDREQTGHDIAVVLGIGPTAHLGYAGIDADTAEQRAAQWGYKIGDTVQLARYDGVEMRVPGHEHQRIVPDNCIRGTFYED